jgi:hypothetical protein
MAKHRLADIFRRLWHTFFGESFRPKAKPVEPQERISRFLCEAEHFNRAKQFVKFRAFLPRIQDIDLSVSRTAGLREGEVWVLADLHVGQPSGRLVIARGDFTPQDVRNVSLDVVPDEPPPAHALLVGWPPAAERERRKTLAFKLAERAQLIVRA